MLLLLLSLHLDARADTCLAGEAYRDGEPFLTTAVLTDTTIVLKGFPGPADAEVQASGGAFVGSNGEQGLTTTDGGLYWEAGAARAVLYPSDCASPTPPQRNVRVGVFFEGGVPGEWVGMQHGFVSVLSRGNVSASWGEGGHGSDYDYRVSVLNARVETEAIKGTWTAKAFFSLKVTRIVHTQSGDLTFDIGSGSMKGSDGFDAILNTGKAAVIRSAQGAALREIPAWICRYAELGLNMQMLSFGPLGAQLSWGREDGVVPGQRYRVKRGDKQSGTLMVVSAPEGEPTANAAWERRRAGAPLDTRMTLQPLPRGALVLGLAGGPALLEKREGRAVELFGGGRWQMGLVGAELDLALGSAPFNGIDNYFLAPNLHLVAMLAGVHLGLGPCAVYIVSSNDEGEILPGAVGTFVVPIAPSFSLLVRGRTLPTTGDAHVEFGVSSW